MKRILFLALLLLSGVAAAQPAPPHRPPPGAMPAPERRLGWEERQRLREQVRNGDMTRDEARQRWHEERARREAEGGRRHEERERLRRDVTDFAPRR